jgi:hypothetical protein
MSSGGSKFNVRDENRKNVLTMPDSKCEDVSPKLKGYICYGIGPITESNYYCDVCDKLKEEKKKKVIDPDFRYDSSVRYDDSDKELDYYKYLDLRKINWFRNHPDRSDWKGSDELYIEAMHRESNVYDNDEPLSSDDDFDAFGEPYNYNERQKRINDAVKYCNTYGYDFDDDDEE